MLIVPRFIMTFGIPGSGKSTWAKKFQKENPRFVRINNDEIRLNIFGNVFNDKDTKVLNELREKMIDCLMLNGRDIILDNANVALKYHTLYKTKCFHFGYDFITEDFSNVPIDVCIERNNKRENIVPEKIIRDMYNNMLRTKNELYTVYGGSL